VRDGISWAPSEGGMEWVDRGPLVLQPERMCLCRSPELGGASSPMMGEYRQDN